MLILIWLSSSCIFKSFTNIHFPVSSEVTEYAKDKLSAKQFSMFPSKGKQLSPAIAELRIY